MDMNKLPIEHVRKLVGYTPRERRGTNGLTRVEMEQVRALLLMGLSGAAVCRVMRCNAKIPNEMRKRMELPFASISATCHPERKCVTDGLCRQCYDIRRALSPATCHPKRPNYRLKGLCKQCYKIKLAKIARLKAKEVVKMATCHQDRPHLARGLCRKCYDVTAQVKRQKAKTCA